MFCTEVSEAEGAALEAEATVTTTSGSKRKAETSEPAKSGRSTRSVHLLSRLLCSVTTHTPIASLTQHAFDLLPQTKEEATTFYL